MPYSTSHWIRKVDSKFSSLWIGWELYLPALCDLFSTVHFLILCTSCWPLRVFTQYKICLFKDMTKIHLLTSGYSSYTHLSCFQSLLHKFQPFLQPLSLISASLETHFWFLPVPQSGKCLRTEIWGKQEAHYICFPFSQGSWSPRVTGKLPVYQFWKHSVQFSSVQSLSHVWLFATPWTAACQASLSITNSWNLPKLISIESVKPSNHLILCHPLLLLPSIFPNIRVFSNESALCIRWPKYWSISFNICPSNEHPGLILTRMDWLDLVAVQGTLKNLLQHHSSKASILRCSAFFTVQLSYASWPLEKP